MKDEVKKNIRKGLTKINKKNWFINTLVTKNILVKIDLSVQ